ncbi:MAG: 4'-phosphopantetheinyl transferase superfamily protein [Candidatus Symbiothrix sp.]|jgi:phosphopantetheinyl transferase|nr:4'-phosphopantetheinyl transferase superfamily protein [Candidatus Symbiothrix sp.]
MTAKFMVCAVPIQASPEDLLAQLERKDWYLPAVGKWAPHRLREWLAVRVLLKRLTGEEKEIKYLPSGKPYLADNSFFIGISHTKNHVAIALHRELPIAVDIERIHSRIEKVADRFLTADEAQQISTAQRLVHLLLHWSAKESLYKLLDIPTLDLQAHLHIHPFEPQSDGIASFTAHETFSPHRQTFTVHYQLTNDFVMTWIISDKRD